MKKYTLNDFKYDFPNREEALIYIMRRRPRHKHSLYRVKGTNAFVNSFGKMWHPLHGTVFFDSHLGLDQWFYGLFLLYNNPKITSRKFASDTKISYRGAYKMWKKLKTRLNTNLTFKQNLNAIIDDQTDTRRRKIKRVVG